jgi:tight adherence protein C
MRVGLVVAWVLVLGALAHRHRPGPRTAVRPRPIRLLPVVVVTVVLVVVEPAIGVAVAAAAALGRWWHVRRDHARRRTDVEAALPHTVDLLAMSIAAGRPVAAALAETSRWAPAAVADDLRRAVDEFALGRPLASVVDDLGARLGREARPLVSALLATERYGVPVADAMLRLVDDMRRRRRLRADAAARRLPVRLTLPLVLAVLPAFGLLTVVPLLLTALDGLGAEATP